MRLIIGGAGQGKLAYAQKTYQVEETAVARDFAAAHRARIFAGLHRAVREELEQGRDPSAALEAVLEENPSVIILCDEVGCGVVPIQPEERRWRETVGRLCCRLARDAESVERLFCGLPMKLK